MSQIDIHISMFSPFDRSNVTLLLFFPEFRRSNKVSPLKNWYAYGEDKDESFHQMSTRVCAINVEHPHEEGSISDIHVVDVHCECSEDDYLSPDDVELLSEEAVITDSDSDLCSMDTCESHCFIGMLSC